jgi:hypothetical protein
VPIEEFQAVGVTPTSEMRLQIPVLGAGRRATEPALVFTQFQAGGGGFLVVTVTLVRVIARATRLAE